MIRSKSALELSDFLQKEIVYKIHSSQKDRITDESRAYESWSSLYNEYKKYTTSTQKKELKKIKIQLEQKLLEAEQCSLEYQIKRITGLFTQKEIKS